MNPYIENENVWEDFHNSFIPALREALTEQVRPKYLVKLEEYLFIHELPDSERRLLGHADLGLSPVDRRGEGGALAVLTPAPQYGQLLTAVDVEKHPYIEIRQREDMALVTVIELLSPSNKRHGSDREQYLSKRHHLLSSPSHLVEIDLLRSGPRLPMEGLPNCDYCVTVSRAQERPRVGIWPITLQEKLPVIPIPLKTSDPDATVDLQKILHRVYDAAGYADYIYRGQPQPPLTPALAGWARQLIPTAG
jgi:hypothetical protein